MDLKKKNHQINKIFCHHHHQKIFLLKKHKKITLQYLFNVLILFKIVSYIKLNLNTKIEPKIFTFKNLEKIWKPWNFFFIEWQP